MIYICIPTTPERRARTQELISSIYTHTKDIPYSIVVYENNDGGWVKAVHNMIENIHGTVWLIGSDCVLKNNAVKILNDTYKMVGGVIEPYNELHGDKLCQHPFGDSELIKKYLDKRFTHWYSDNYFTILANRENKLHYEPKAIIEHKHFINGKAENDKTYETIFNPETVEKDRQLFIKLTQQVI